MTSESPMQGGQESRAADDPPPEHSHETDNQPAQGSPMSGGEEATDGAAEQENDSEPDDGADYDPESVALEPPSAEAAVEKTTSPSATQQQPTAKPKTSGGFLVEVSDDEDDGKDLTPSNLTPQAKARPDQVAVAAVAAKTGPSPSPANEVPSKPPPVMPTLDPVALLEARIKEDPRGDMDAWLSLIADHKRRNRLPDLRNLYNRFVEVFPQAADIWVDWIELELGLDNFMEAEHLFGRCLMTVLNVKLWTVYLNYIRRRNDLTNDPTGQARRTVSQAYEFVIENVGLDRDSGNIWQDYIHFIKSGPGQVGGTGWQDQQKMDQLRKAFHRAITVPMLTVNNMWREYDMFEMGLNKVTGRKFIQERSPAYMSAKSANIALDNMMRRLKRTNLPRLPPASGFEGDDEFRNQAALWKKWIDWEKDDPLVLKSDEPQVYKQRVLYCYRQALMTLRFWPEIWVEAASWCLDNGVRDNDSKPVGTELLLQGIAANPESVLLALKHADHIEAHYPEKEGDRSEYAKAVRQPYDAVLDTLYKMGDKVKERETLEVTTLKQAAAREAGLQPSIEPADDTGVSYAGAIEIGGNDDDDDDDDDDDARKKGAKKSPTEERIAAIHKAYAVESQVLSKTISHVWIALARAMRRIQGKGSQTEGGLRKVFTDARQRGRLTSDVYVAVALLESVVYKDPVGPKIFERGARLFPNDENFMIEYIKYLHSRDDTTNARVVFETCVNRLVSEPETVARAKPLYSYFHKYESQFGELSQVSKLEDRMAELFPEDTKLSCFAARYSSPKFDPISTPIIISKAVQMRPKQTIPTIEQPVAIPSGPGTMPSRRQVSPRQHNVRNAGRRTTASPKRSFGVDDDDPNPPKRIARGVSPLKGAAGRRLDQQRRNQASALHRDITFLLGILPPAHSYDGQRLHPAALVSLLRETPLPDYSSWRAKTGGQYRIPAHGLHQAPGEFVNRPLSPYGRLAPVPVGYRGSPLRPESGGVVYPGPPYVLPESGGGVPPTWHPPAPGQYGGFRY